MMLFRKNVLVALLVSSGLLFAASCGTSDKAADRPADTGVNLIALSKVARQNAETGVYDMSAPRLSYYFLGNGWSAPYPEENFAERAILVVNSFARLRMNVIKPADRWFAFTIKAQGHYGGPEKQTVTVQLGETTLDTFPLSGSDPLRRVVFLPAAEQKAGINIIIFRFSDFDASQKFSKSRNERRGFPYRGVAAYLADMRILFAAPEEGRPELTREERQVFETANEDRVMRQHASSQLTYGFPPQEGAVLHVAGSFEPGAGEKGTISAAVQVRTDTDQEWVDLWRKNYEAGAARQSFSGDYTLEVVGKYHFEVRLVCDSSRGGWTDSSVIWNRLALELPKESRPAAAMPERQPVRLTDKARNVVIIVLDAFRADQLGGIKDGAHTPNLSALAKESILFTNAVTAAPYTVASVSSIFSSLIPDAHGVRRGRDTFPEHLDTMAKAFVRKKYYTMVLAGLPFIKRKFGITRACEKEVYLRPDADRAAGISRMDLKLIHSSIQGAKESGKPIFIYTHLLPPHWPYSPPEPFGDTKNFDGKANEKRQRKLREDVNLGKVKPGDQRLEEFFNDYKRNLEYGDFVAETMIGYLKEFKLYDDTLLIIAADHGEAFGEHRALGHSSTTYEEMIHVPLMFHYPGVKHDVFNLQVGLVDLFPTIAELMGLDIETKQIDGRSFAPLLVGKQLAPQDYYYTRAVDYTVVLKRDKVEYSFDRTRFSLRGAKYKYHFNDWNDELYDLLSDPEEKFNLAPRFPALTTALRQHGLALIARAQARREAGPHAEIGAEEEEELRNLGYLQ